MSRGVKVAVLLAAVTLFGLAVYWLASGKLMDWLLALHGR